MVEWTHTRHYRIETFHHLACARDGTAVNRSVPMHVLHRSPLIICLSCIPIAVPLDCRVPLHAWLECLHRRKAQLLLWESYVHACVRQHCQPGHETGAQGQEPVLCPVPPNIWLAGLFNPALFLATVAVAFPAQSNAAADEYTLQVCAGVLIWVFLIRCHTPPLPATSFPRCCIVC